MRPSVRLGLCGASAALELGALPGLLSAASAPASALLAHGAAALLALLALRPALPPGAAGARALLLLAPLALLLPLLGPLGLAALSGRPRPRAPGEARTVRSFSLPALGPLALEQRRGYSRGGLGAVLRHEPSASRRLQAVMDTRRLKPRDAVEILKLALRDPTDDVRLLAYALLDRREQGLQRRIQAALRDLPRATGEAALALHRRLARDHFELVHLGLSSGEARVLLLRAARRHAEAYLDGRPGDGGTRFLLGRLLLLLGEPEAAAEALRRAEAAGVGEVKLLPYLAEAAFQRRRFAEVRALMGRLPPMACRTQPRLDEMRAYWR